MSLPLRAEDINAISGMLQALWLKLPDLRLGQLVDCLNKRAQRLSNLDRCDQFAMTDIYMLAAIQEWRTELHKEKG